jgi:hypothetical protein
MQNIITGSRAAPQTQALHDTICCVGSCWAEASWGKTFVLRTGPAPMARLTIYSFGGGISKK